MWSLLTARMATIVTLFGDHSDYGNNLSLKMAATIVAMSPFPTTLGD